MLFARFFYIAIYCFNAYSFWFHVSFVNKTFIVKSLYIGTDLDERDKDAATSGEMPRVTGKYMNSQENSSILVCLHVCFDVTRHRVNT